MGVPHSAMGLCKCPRRRVTPLFCFEHRVNVCESCMISSHPKVCRGALMGRLWGAYGSLMGRWGWGVGAYGALMGRLWG